MKIFSYTAQEEKTGKKIKAQMSAEDSAGVVRALRDKQYIPFKIQEVSTRASGFVLKRPVNIRHYRVKSREVAVFTRQLAATLGAGLLLSDALATVADDMEDKNFQAVVLAVRQAVISGGSFSESLMQFPRIFSKSYTSVVRTGEATGKLFATLESLAKFLEHIERIRGKVKSATSYPLFVFGFAIFLVVGMVLFIIPKFKAIFEQSGVPLPGLTRAVLSLSDFMISYWLWIMGAILILIYLAHHLAKFPRVAYLLDEWKLKIPLIGKSIIHKSLVSSFCRTLGFMLGSGVSLPVALDITGQVVNSQPMQASIAIIRKRVMAGKSMTEALREHKLFPRFVGKMSSIGEKTGRISDMMNRTSDYYDEELENSIHSLVTMIEPALIIVVGVIVALVVVALYLPIFKVSSLIR